MGAAVSLALPAGAAIGLQRSCPVCDGTSARPAWREDSQRYVRCSSCTTLFSDVDEAQYTSCQHNVWHDLEMLPATLAFYGRAREPAHRRFLSANPPSPGAKLLDVGCGLGFFVERALEAGWDAYGCDPSPAWVSRAQARAGGDRIRLGTVEQAFDPADTFDLISTWDVLEHIFDPVTFLAAIARRLAPGGHLFIRTPNEAWVYPTYAARRWLLAERVELGPLNHVVYFRAATLRRALEAAGLRAVAWPCLPPPQVGYGNRNPADTARRTLVIRAKNAHARAARKLAVAADGRVVLSADLDVLAVRDSDAATVRSAARVPNR